MVHTCMWITNKISRLTFSVKHDKVKVDYFQNDFHYLSKLPTYLESLIKLEACNIKYLQEE